MQGPVGGGGGGWGPRGALHTWNTAQCKLLTENFAVLYKLDELLGERHLEIYDLIVTVTWTTSGFQCNSIFILLDTVI